MAKSTQTNEKSKSAIPRNKPSGEPLNSEDLALKTGVPPTYSSPEVFITARFSFVILTLLASAFIFFKDSPLPDRRQSFQALSHLQLKRLESQFQNAAKESSLRLWDWIHSRSDHAGAFSEEALSWRGKWQSVQPWLPWGKKNADRDFLQSIFHKHLFKPSELEEAIRIEWITAQMRWDEAENLFLIQEGDLDNDLFGDTHSPVPNQAALNGDTHNFDLKPTTENMGGPISVGQLELDRIQAENHKQTVEGVGQVVLAEVSSEILARALTRLAISMGILSTGASSSAYTFGAGAVLGLIIDQCYSWIQQPEKKLELELKLALELLADEVSKAHLELLEERMQIRLHLWNLHRPNF